MSEEKIVVTIGAAVQVGMDEWQMRYTSRVFATSRPIKDMLSWAEAEGIKNPQISDLQLSKYTGESV